MSVLPYLTILFTSLITLHLASIPFHSFFIFQIPKTTLYDDIMKMTETELMRRGRKIVEEDNRQSLLQSKKTVRKRTNEKREEYAGQLKRSGQK